VGGEVDEKAKKTKAGGREGCGNMGEGVRDGDRTWMDVHTGIATARALLRGCAVQVLLSGLGELEGVFATVVGGHDVMLWSKNWGMGSLDWWLAAWEGQFRVDVVLLDVEWNEESVRVRARTKFRREF
jgi:hypothetical protein